jgi:TonB family protein
MKPYSKYSVSFLVVSLFTLGVAHPQGTSVPAASESKTALKYANSTEGLRQFLTDIRDAAKSDDMGKVATFLEGTEIPNCADWLHKMYVADSADSWMGLCDSKTLSSEEKSMQELFATLAQEEGEISTRKVNDNPEPGRGMEWGWLQAIKQPLDIFFASWKTAQDAQGSKGKPIGYFMFIDGGFRWESGIQFFTPKIGTLKVVPAKLVKQIAPVYPPDAAAQGITGTVRVYFNIGSDGVVKDVHALSGEGLSNDPSLRKAAEDAVIQWRYEPGTVDGKPAESDAMTANIVFSPKN